jgi:predicted metalloprotease
MDKAEANALQVRVELQADCLAGVWANHAQAKWNSSNLVMSKLPCKQPQPLETIDCNGELKATSCRTLLPTVLRRSERAGS